MKNIFLALAVILFAQTNAKAENLVLTCTDEVHSNIRIDIFEEDSYSYAYPIVDHRIIIYQTAVAGLKSSFDGLL